MTWLWAVVTRPKGIIEKGGASISLRKTKSQGNPTTTRAEAKGKMATGVGVHDDVITQFNDFKLKREPHNYRYFIYKIVEDSQIVIEATAPQTATYEDFAQKLLEVNDCRYGLIDLDVMSKDGRPTSKIVFISWSPDTARVKSKMLYAASKEALTRVLMGVGIRLTATDASELSREVVEDSVAKFV